MKLSGITLKNFRSIGNDAVKIYPLETCNVVIGRNNVGKSNVLRAIQFILHNTKTDGDSNRMQLNLDDFHLQDTSRNFEFTLSFCGVDDDDEKLINLCQIREFEFTFFMTRQGTIESIDYSFTKLSPEIAVNVVQPVLGTQFQFNGTPNKEGVRQVFLDKQAQIFGRYFKSALPNIVFIPEFRRIQEGSGYNIAGTGLPTLLNHLKNPDVRNGRDKIKFSKIEKFLQHLLKMPKAKLEIDYDDHILLASDDTDSALRLPLEHYGTGVHQLLIFLTALFTTESSFFCIEEPEIHLHPNAQRELIRFLVTEASQHQYLISTHSAALINVRNDLPEELRKKLQVFHIQSKSGVTVGGPVLKTEQTLAALSDLGVRPSDLLQANCIIWVEGPSDRIYINKWIQLIDPALVEGVDYAVMFYGGRLLSTVSFERDAVTEDLIELLKINQKAVVVIDSDRKKESEDINETKARINRECQQSDSICWITHGREIENYLDNVSVDCYARTIKNPERVFKLTQYQKFDDAWKRFLGTDFMSQYDYSIHKPKLAKEFVKYIEKNNISEELVNQIQLVVNQIKNWNSSD